MPTHPETKPDGKREEDEGEQAGEEDQKPSDAAQGRGLFSYRGRETGMYHVRGRERENSVSNRTHRNMFGLLSFTLL